jgi:LysR family nitrogen assimilation transcriptional regulator
MDIKQLEYFVCVAENQSFSRAAMVLNIAQSALSRQVRSLEVELRETLLLRTGRGVKLTDAGQRLLEHANTILHHVSVARDQMGAMRDEPVGRITIGLPPSMSRQLTRGLVDGFVKQMPKAHLAIVEGLSTHMAEWLMIGRVDLALLHNPDPQLGLDLVPLLSEPLCLVSRRADVPHDEATADIPLADLEEVRLILPQRGHMIRKVLESQAMLAGLNLFIAWEVSSVPAIVELVCEGYGHAVLPLSAVAASGRGAELSTRRIVQPGILTTLCLAQLSHRRATALTRRAEALLKGLVEALPRLQSPGLPDPET